MAKRRLAPSPAVVNAAGQVVGDWAEWADILGDDVLPTDAPQLTEPTQVRRLLDKHRRASRARESRWHSKSD